MHIAYTVIILGIVLGDSLPRKFGIPPGNFDNRFLVL